MHGSRIKAVATDSCMANAMPCSVDRRWYCRSRAICGSTREPDDDGAPPLPPRTASWCLSICLRHLAHRSIVDGGSSSPPVTAGFVKNAARPTCFVVSAVRRHAKQSTSTLPSVASRAWRRRFLESFVLMAGGDGCVRICTVGKPVVKTSVKPRHPNLKGVEGEASSEQKQARGIGRKRFEGPLGQADLA